MRHQVKYSISGNTMNLVKTLLRIRFETATNPWLELRALLRSAASDPKIEMQAAPVVVDRKEAKTRISLQIRAVGLEHESTGSLAEATAHVRATMMGLNEASSFPDVEMMGYDVAFIDPVDMPFHELVEHIKAHFLLPTRIVNLSSDVGLVLDQREDGLLKHVQLGPMDRAQLASELLRWPNEDEIPDTFVFIDLGYEKTNNIAFSRDALEAFFQEAVEWQEAEANTLFNELKGGG